MHLLPIRNLRAAFEASAAVVMATPRSTSVHPLTKSHVRATVFVLHPCHATASAFLQGLFTYRLVTLKVNLKETRTVVIVTNESLKNRKLAKKESFVAIRFPKKQSDARVSKPRNKNPIVVKKNKTLNVTRRNRPSV